MQIIFINHSIKNLVFIISWCWSFKGGSGWKYAHTSTLEGNGSMDAGGDLGSAAKGLAIGLEVAGSGPVSCRFFIPFFSLPCVVL